MHAAPVRVRAKCVSPAEAAALGSPLTKRIRVSPHCRQGHTVESLPYENNFIVNLHHRVNFLRVCLRSKRNTILDFAFSTIGIWDTPIIEGEAASFAPVPRKNDLECMSCWSTRLKSAPRNCGRVSPYSQQRRIKRVLTPANYLAHDLSLPLILFSRCIFLLTFVIYWLHRILTFQCWRPQRTRSVESARLEGIIGDMNKGKPHPGSGTANRATGACERLLKRQQTPALRSLLTNERQAAQRPAPNLIYVAIIAGAGPVLCLGDFFNRSLGNRWRLIHRNWHQG
jgi:hypothetical protein